MLSYKGSSCSKLRVTDWKPLDCIILFWVEFLLFNVRGDFLKNGFFNGTNTDIMSIVCNKLFPWYVIIVDDNYQLHYFMCIWQLPVHECFVLKNIISVLRLPLQKDNKENSNTGVLKKHRSDDLQDLKIKQPKRSSSRKALQSQNWLNWVIYVL